MPDASGGGQSSFFPGRVCSYIENGVAIDIRMTEVDPPGRIGKSVVDAATAAILRCGPYSGADAGTITLAVESEE